MVQTWYWISQNTLASAASSERLSYQRHPTLGEVINCSSHNGGKLHPKFAAQSHSSDRFNQDSKISVPPSYFLHFSWQSLQFASVSVQSFQIALDFIFLFDDFSVSEYPLITLCNLSSLPGQANKEVSKPQHAPLQSTNSFIIRKFLTCQSQHPEHLLKQMF